MSKTWKIDPEGVLTILPGFRKTKGQSDFYALRDEIKAIVVEEGAHEIGDDWFCYLAVRASRPFKQTFTASARRC